MHAYANRVRNGKQKARFAGKSMAVSTDLLWVESVERLPKNQRLLWHPRSQPAPQTHGVQAAPIATNFGDGNPFLIRPVLAMLGKGTKGNGQGEVVS